MSASALERGLGLLRWGAVLAGLWALGASVGPCWRALTRAAPVPPALGPAAASPVAPGAAAEQYAPIAARNLFRASTRRAPRAAAEPAQPSQSGLLLLGTVFAQPADGSLAVVRDPGEPRPRLVEVGASMRGAQVLEIERGALLLRRSGRIERLVLHTPALSPAPPRRERDLERRDAGPIRGRPVPSRQRAQGTAARGRRNSRGLQPPPDVDAAAPVAPRAPVARRQR